MAATSKKGSKPMGLNAKAAKKVQAYKSKPRGVSAKVTPKSSRPSPVSPSKSKRK